MDPKHDIGGHATLPGEVLPTDRTLAVDGVQAGPSVALPEGPFRIGRFTAVRQLGSGAMGVVVTALAIRDRQIAPTINYSTPDPDCDLDYVPNEPRPAEIDYVLSNSFGFGGTNAALLFKRYEE